MLIQKHGDYYSRFSLPQFQSAFITNFARTSTETSVVQTTQTALRANEYGTQSFDRGVTLAVGQQQQ